MIILVLLIATFDGFTLDLFNTTFCLLWGKLIQSLEKAASLSLMTSLSFSFWLYSQKIFLFYILEDPQRMLASQGSAGALDTLPVHRESLLSNF